jgi:hypothetical protein
METKKRARDGLAARAGGFPTNPLAALPADVKPA